MHIHLKLSLLGLLFCFGHTAIYAQSSLQLKNLQGDAVQVPLRTGNTQVFNFWAAWCGPCQDEIPSFNKLAKQFASKPIRIIGIALDSADNVRNFQKNLPLLYPNYLGQENTLDQMRQLGNTSGTLPFTIIIDPQGRVIYKKTGLVTEQELKPYLQ